MQKEAQDLKAGNTFKVGNDLFIIQKALYNKGARNSSTVKMKVRNIATNSVSETVYKAANKFEVIVLDRRPMQYLYSNGDFYTMMDQENFEQIDLTSEDLGDALNFLAEQMVINVLMYGEKAVGVETPDKVDLKIAYTEPAARGDTSGKVMKPAKLETGYEIQVPAYCVTGEKVRVDTKTGEFLSRAQ
jgi:elongation factor P